MKPEPVLALFYLLHERDTRNAVLFSTGRSITHRAVASLLPAAKMYMDGYLAMAAVEGVRLFEVSPFCIDGSLAEFDFHYSRQSKPIM